MTDAQQAILKFLRERHAAKGEWVAKSLILKEITNSGPPEAYGDVAAELAGLMLDGAVAMEWFNGIGACYRAV